MSTTAVTMKSFVPTQNSPGSLEIRRIVHEEIKREKELEKLEADFKAGEITEFDYKVQKFILNSPIMNDNIGAKLPKYSTTA